MCLLKVICFSHLGSKMLEMCYTEQDFYVGLQGGISNGEIINMRIAFKPTSTIGVSLISLPLSIKTNSHVGTTLPIVM